METNLSPLLSAPLLSAGSTSTDSKHSKIVNAATQFEALLIGEMMKSVREASDDGWLGGGSDSSAESAFGIAENQFAQTISQRGGFGLAKTIEKSLESDSRVAATSENSQ